MKASELIHTLLELVAQKGDRDVCCFAEPEGYEEAGEVRGVLRCFLDTDGTFQVSSDPPPKPYIPFPQTPQELEQN